MLTLTRVRVGVSAIPHSSPKPSPKSNATDPEDHRKEEGYRQHARQPLGTWLESGLGLELGLGLEFGLGLGLGLALGLGYPKLTRSSGVKSSNPMRVG